MCAVLTKKNLDRTGQNDGPIKVMKFAKAFANLNKTNKGGPRLRLISKKS
jgi:hypothetical protein